MQVALSLEKSVNQALLDLHEVASSHKDAQVSRKFFEPFVKYIAMNYVHTLAPSVSER